ncbi:DUF3108 domain-containing protein [Undibacterium sp.]|uniref:DUF3108 domain-containing protein n=1 Tax=Undibacterium sp. TaxID=1914977 RepID=UPI00375034A4
MSEHLFLSQPIQHLSKLSTWLFLLATILLHIFILESGALKEWTPKPILKELPNISVSLRPTTEAQAPAADKASPLQKKTNVAAREPMAQVVPEPTVASRVEEKPAPTPEVAATEIIDVKNQAPIATDNEIGKESSTELPEFNLRVPESAEMQMEITHSKVNGSTTSGVGKLSWEQYNGKYRLSIDAGINLVVTNLNLLTITSEGHIDLYGLMPTVSNDIRRNRPATAIHFNHTEKIISFSASNNIVSMENGAQDAVSVLIQLAAIGYANAAQLEAGKEFTIQVAEGRDAKPFVFQVLGEEEIDSKLAENTGKLKTVHIIRPPKPGFYNSQLDIWLAPSLGWYPVQIRNTENNGTVTNQIVVALKQKISYAN